MARFSSFASHKISRSGIFTLLVCIAALWATPESACAQLYVAQYGFGTVSEYNPTSGAAINVNLIATGLSAPAGLALSGNTLFVANSGANMVGKYTVNAYDGHRGQPYLYQYGFKHPDFSRCIR
jgi:hypothetical protein